jgi:DNA glycosylase AlkZ-like
VRVLTLRELNRATLARQYLLERRKLSAPTVIERLAGMQAQWPQAPYVGLWTRIPAFRRDTLERAIRSGKVVKATVMRGTLHLVTERDYGMFWAALRDMRAWADDESLELGTRLAPELRAMFDDGPLTFQQVLERLANDHGIEDELTRRRTWWVARTTGHVLHAPETALFAARPQALFAAVAEPAPVEATLARAELARRYLAAFGPAARADLADWSGMRVSDFAEALESLEPLRRFRDERGRELLDVPRAPLPDASTPAPVRFLPKWDNVLLGFADRTRVLPDEYRKTVIAKNGDVAQTFLVDGLVAGTWRAEKAKVKLEPFAPLPRAARREAEDEAARLAGFLR